MFHYISLFFSITPLIIAYICEYFFDMTPCHLCSYERILFIFIIVLSITLILFRKKLLLYKIIQYFILFLFLSNLCLSIYHIGVEKKIFTLPVSCKINANYNQYNRENLTNKAIEETLKSQKIVRCDIPTLLFGIPMSILNAIYCFIVFTILIHYIMRQKKMFNI